MFVTFLTSYYLRQNLTLPRIAAESYLCHCQVVKVIVLLIMQNIIKINIYFFLVTGTSFSPSKTISRHLSSLESFENLGTTHMQFMYSSKIHSCRIPVQCDTKKAQGLGQTVILFLFTLSLSLPG